MFSKKLSAKNKIFAILAAWVVAGLVLQFYIYKILDNSNTALVGKIEQQNREVSVLDAERISFEKAQEDLNELSKKELQPEDLFSRDVTLVNEVKYLEELGRSLGLELNLSGLSGTTKNAPKAKTQGELVVVPYVMNVVGSFSKVVDFIETFENLPFITVLEGLSLSTLGTGEVSVNMRANFYLKK